MPIDTGSVVGQKNHTDRTISPIRRMLAVVAAVVMALTLGSPAPLFAAESGDGVWRDIDERSFRAAGERRIIPQRYRTVSLDWTALARRLSAAPPERLGRPNESETILTLPLPDGGYGRFRIEESPIMEPGLAEKYPEIKTYRGQGVDDPTATVRFDRTPLGFHAMILSTSGTVYIDPYSNGDTSRYTTAYKRDYPRPARARRHACGVDSSAMQSPFPRHRRLQRPNGTQLRTYRLAVAAVGEFTALYGNVGTAVFQIVTGINRVTGVYENELAIRLTLVANNNVIVFPNANTDPYTNGADNDLTIDENQAVVDNAIGAANYDIGHVFTASGGGVAAPGVCTDGVKATAVTGDPNANPGDPFYIDFVAHEMGHQFFANHTWNTTSAGSCEPGAYAASAAYEPGSGSTIMAYAGICNPENLQPNSDAYFHAISYDEILAYVDNPTGGGACGTPVATGNTPPVAEAGPAYTIPSRTPFELCGSGTDADGDALTYGWEQFDLGPAGSAGQPSGNAPIFRSFPATTSPCRTFPRLTDLLANTTNIGETLPTYARNLTFRLNVRDNRANGGGVNHDNTTLTVVDTTTPFSVTDPNTAETWTGATQETVAWQVSGTNTAPINCASVDVSLSADGGNNYLLSLLTNTPNDGAASVFVPSLNTTTGRIQVRCANNIFFDVSNADISVTPNLNCATDLNLTAQTVTDGQYFEAGNTVSNPAGTAFVVGTTGDVTVRSSGSVRFRNGFAVRTGGRLTARVVAGICPT